MNRLLPQFVQLLLVNFRSYLREPAIIFWALVFPMAIAGVLGFAFTRDAAPVVRVGVLSDNVALRAALEQRITGQADRDALLGRFELVPMDSGQALQQLQRGRISLYVSGSSPAALRAHFDPSNQEARMAWLALERALDNRSAWRARPIPLDQAGSRYIDFLIPGLLALGVMNSSMWGICYGLIDLRSKKLLRRMMASPMSRPMFFVSHMAARLVFAVAEALILLSFGALVFGVQMQGGLGPFVLIFLAGNIAWGGIAVLCSSRAESMTAANGILNAVTLPMTILSGIFFSYQNFPVWTHAVIEVLPLTILADALRAVLSEGAGFGATLLPATGLILMGLGFGALGLRIYRWH